jgi:membrane protease YdiL (CAAX protease family)
MAQRALKSIAAIAIVCATIFAFECLANWQFNRFVESRAAQILASESNIGDRPIHKLPEEPAEQRELLAKLSETRDPLVVLPEAFRVEPRIQARKALLVAIPEAIPLATNALPQLNEEEGVETRSETLRWIALVVFAGALVTARLRPPRKARVRAALEIALVFAGPTWLIVGGNLSAHPDAFQISLMTATLIYASSLAWPRSWVLVGSARAWWLAAAIVILAIVFGLVGRNCGETFRSVDITHALRYPLWALVQQFLVCVVCTERLLIVTKRPAAAIYLGALAFALLHTPNASLMIATFIGGLCWCALYLRERALLPLAFSHAACALVLLELLPREVLLSAEVSVRFFQ